jgi:hypothetical protein
VCAARAQAGTGVDCLGHDSVDVGELLGVDERAERDLLGVGVADRQALRALGQALEVPAQMRAGFRARQLPAEIGDQSGQVAHAGRGPKQVMVGPD